jgi:hypothetical protein
MNNIHGQRINMDVPVREGSGFVGKHGADFINFNDRWSQVLNLLTGPDGSVFMIDWYDKNQCHHNDVNGHDRSNGRIFKISYGEPKAKLDLAKLTNGELGASPSPDAAFAGATRLYFFKSGPRLQYVPMAMERVLVKQLTGEGVRPKNPVHQLRVVGIAGA